VEVQHHLVAARIARIRHTPRVLARRALSPVGKETARERTQPQGSGC
jgi:hypothetical protein